LLFVVPPLGGQTSSRLKAGLRTKARLPPHYLHDSRFPLAKGGKMWNMQERSGRPPLTAQIFPQNRSKFMADFVIHVGSHSAQGVRPNNEDRFVVDLVNHLFLVADGMGGQERGEQASGMAAD